MSRFQLAACTSEVMATFTYDGSFFFIDKCDGGISIRGVAPVAVHARRSIRIECLPFGKENVKVVVKRLPLGDVPVALQAIAIRYGAGHRGGLSVMFAHESHKIPGA